MVSWSKFSRGLASPGIPGLGGTGQGLLSGLNPDSPVCLWTAHVPWSLSKGSGSGLDLLRDKRKCHPRTCIF